MAKQLHFLRLLRSAEASGVVTRTPEVCPAKRAGAEDLALLRASPFLQRWN